MNVVQLLLPLPDLNLRLANAQGQLAQDLAKDPAIASALILQGQQPMQRVDVGEAEDSD